MKPTILVEAGKFTGYYVDVVRELGNGMKALLATTNYAKSG